MMTWRALSARPYGEDKRRRDEQAAEQKLAMTEAKSRVEAEARTRAAAADMERAAADASRVMASEEQRRTAAEADAKRRAAAEDSRCASEAGLAILKTHSTPI